MSFHYPKARLMFKLRISPIWGGLLSRIRWLPRPCRPIFLGLLCRVLSYISIPKNHRLFLMAEEQDFDRKVKSRFLGSSYTILNLHNRLILPFLDILEGAVGGSAYKGGPTHCTEALEPALRHFRGDRCIDNPVFPPEDILKNTKIKSGYWFWCGPLCHHFGHQIADFGSRVLLSSMDWRPGSLLWMRKQHEPSSELHPWERFILNYLNPAGKPVVIESEAMSVKNLVVYPQQARMHASPTLAHLEALTLLQLQLEPVDVADVVYISRSKIAACTTSSNLVGAYAGELAFEHILASKGVQVLYPENQSVPEQLKVYRSARTLIVAEGSAQHGLELLGFDQSKNVIVICRRPQKYELQLPLKARFPNAEFVEVSRTFYTAPGAVPWKALAVLAWDRVAQSLKSIGVRLTSAEIESIESAASLQITKLVQSVGIEEISPKEVGILIEKFRQHNNANRPHNELGYKLPAPVEGSSHLEGKAR